MIGFRARVRDGSRNLLQHDPLYIEILSGAAMASWGEAASDLNAMPAYSLFTRSLDGDWLQGAALVAGTTQTLFVWLFFDKRWGRFGIAFVMCCLWAGLAWIVSHAPGSPPGARWAFGFAAANAVSMLFLLKPRRAVS